MIGRLRRVPGQLTRGGGDVDAAPGIHPTLRTASAAGAAGLIFAAIALVPTEVEGYLLSQMLYMAVVIDLAIVWNVVAGFGGQLSLAHGTMFGLGAYAVAVSVVVYGRAAVLGLLAGIVLAGLLGLAVTVLTLRYRIRGIYFALVTLAVSILVQSAASNSDTLGSALGLTIPPATDPRDFRFGSQTPYLIIFVILGWLLFLGSRWLREAALGILLRAAKDDPTALQALGHGSGAVVAVAMAATGAVAGLLGGLYALAVLFITPDATLGLDITFAILVSTIIGGIGSVWGPLLGGLIYEGGLVAVSQIPGGSESLPIIANAVFGALIVVVVAARPRGLTAVLR